MATTPNLGITLLEANLRQPETVINAAFNTLDNAARVREMLTDEVSITGAVTLNSTAFGKMHVITGTSADYTITLWTPVTADLGKIVGFRVSNAGTKVYTLDAAGAETIDGVTTLTLRKNDVIYLKAVATTGNTWQVVDSKRNLVFTGAYCDLIRTTNQSINSGTATAISWDTEISDALGMHDGTNPARITPPAPGIIVVSASGEFAGSALGTYRQLHLARYNSSSVLQEYFAQDLRLPSATSYQARLQVATSHYCNLGDYFEAHGVQDSGGALNFLANPNTADNKHTGRFRLIYLGKIDA